MTGRQLEIVQSAKREPFGNYHYTLYDGGKPLAEIEHCYRGNEFWMRKPGGNWIGTDRTLDGGGPELLRLNKIGHSTLADLLGAT